MTETPSEDVGENPLAFETSPDVPPPQDINYLPDLGFKTYYDLIDANPGSTESEIKDAYRDTLKRIHPDRGDHPHAEFLMARLQEARRVLLDTDTRKRYHAVGHWRFIKQHTDREVTIPSHAQIEPITEPIPDLLPDTPEDTTSPSGGTTEDSEEVDSLSEKVLNLKDSVLPSASSSQVEPSGQPRATATPDSTAVPEPTESLSGGAASRTSSEDVVEDLLNGSGASAVTAAEVYDVSRGFDSALGRNSASQERFTSVKRLCVLSIAVPLLVWTAIVFVAPVPVPVMMKAAAVLITAPLLSVIPVLGFRYVAPDLVDDVHRERVRSPESRRARQRAQKYGAIAFTVTVGVSVASSYGLPWGYLARVIFTQDVVATTPWIDLASVSAPALTVPVNLLGAVASVLTPILAIAAGVQAFVLEPVHERLVAPQYRVFDFPSAMGTACLVMATAGLFLGVALATTSAGGGAIPVVALSLGLAGMTIIAAFSK